MSDELLYECPVAQGPDDGDGVDISAGVASPKEEELLEATGEVTVVRVSGKWLMSK